MSDLNLSISSELVKPIIEAKIQAAIVAELGKSADLIESVVAKALMDKVDEKGQKANYSSDNKFTFLERICYTEIQVQTRAAIKELLETQKDKIKEAMKKQITKNLDKLAVSFVDACLERTKSDYAFKVDLKLEENKSYYR